MLPGSVKTTLLSSPALALNVTLTHTCLGPLNGGSPTTGSPPMYKSEIVRALTRTTESVFPRQAPQPLAGSLHHFSHTEQQLGVVQTSLLIQMQASGLHIEMSTSPAPPGRETSNSVVPIRCKPAGHCACPNATAIAKANVMNKMQRWYIQTEHEGREKQEQATACVELSAILPCSLRP